MNANMLDDCQNKRFVSTKTEKINDHLKTYTSLNPAIMLNL